MDDQKKPSQQRVTSTGTGLHCANHPDAEAYGMCMYCGKFFCQACLVEIHGKQYCKEHVEVAIVGERTTPSGNAGNTNSHNTYNNDHSSNHSNNTYNNNNSTNNSNNTYNNDHSTNNSGNTYNYYYGDPTSSGATSYYSGSNNASTRSTSKSGENESSSDATNTQDLPWYKKVSLWVTNTFNVTTTAPAAPSHKPTKKGKNRLIALILCIIGFFGFAGLHRMYVGKIGSGVLYLFTFGGFYIGTIIDTLSILGGHFKDKKGREL